MHEGHGRDSLIRACWTDKPSRLLPPDMTMVLLMQAGIQVAVCTGSVTLSVAPRRLPLPDASQRHAFGCHHETSATLAPRVSTSAFTFSLLTSAPYSLSTFICLVCSPLGSSSRVSRGHRLVCRSRQPSVNEPNYLHSSRRTLPSRAMPSRATTRLLVGAFAIGAVLLAYHHSYTPSLSLGSVGASLASVATSSTSHFPKKRRMQLVKAGGIPKEGLGSSIGFVLAAANIAALLDADMIVSQTAGMFDYRVSDYLSRGVEMHGGPGVRTCDILEVLLSTPGDGTFQARMDRAVSLLDDLYVRAEERCRVGAADVSSYWPTSSSASPASQAQRDAVAALPPLLSDYALRELSRCDVLVLNDYRTITRGFTPCNMQWWSGVIAQYSGPAHGNDVAIHFRWGDMFAIAQTTSDKWRFNMTLVARAVDIIREANPTVVVNVFMKKSRNNESERQMRDMLRPLAGDYNIVEAETDIEELAIMSKARYLIMNAGSYSIAAAATANAQVVVHNGGGAQGSLNQMRLKHCFDYNKYDEDELREAARP